MRVCGDNKYENIEKLTFDRFFKVGVAFRGPMAAQHETVINIAA